MGISMNLKIFLTIGIVIYIYLTVKSLLKNDLQSSFLTFYFVSTIGLVVRVKRLVPITKRVILTLIKALNCYNDA